MNISNQEWNTYARNTMKQGKQSTDTGTKNYEGSESTSWLSRSEAHKILDRVKDGTMTPYHLICEALRQTGDLQRKELT